ncbi:MAG TPA: VOC family protein [Bryobacteraceae bacterium]|jgi:predicted enzyme related to lactoylglutathione lyase|nr:VOC family protein [Bryobacteraceae bacterium]
MNGSPRFAGVELYFYDLERARTFYREVLGLTVADEETGQYTRFDSGSGFVCLERKGSEQYRSRDKAVLFFEVEDLAAARAAIGEDRFVHNAEGWAVLHDPEGHNVLLLERKTTDAGE